MDRITFLVGVVAFLSLFSLYYHLMQSFYNNRSKVPQDQDVA